jgi:hypothetical protein
MAQSGEDVDPEPKELACCLPTLCAGLQMFFQFSPFGFGQSPDRNLGA